MLATLRRLASTAPLGSRGARGVAFVAASSPRAARGLKRDPEEYMVSPHGIKYPGAAGTLAPARKFMGDFALPDELLLQCLTHKSFAHGKVPYNEKLAIVGQQLLRFEAFRSAAETPTAPVEVTVNDKNFNIGATALELLSSTPVLSRVCDNAGLEPAMFYRPANVKTGPRVKAKTINALVGALLLERGAPVATKFVSARLLSGEHSVFRIADQLYVHK